MSVFREKNVTHVLNDDPMGKLLLSLVFSRDFDKYSEFYFTTLSNIYDKAFLPKYKRLKAVSFFLQNASS